ncbi:CLUMA_CG015752, isoform A [Clunio marinus]|uniref:Elongator complex protein 2 n=1 Tax=Clunio marinus TaxID=568069 RepID=A0A1J1IT22_9DIPT|nr:CLUMA_CG015752, isoform A [Clunio marinus]
MIVKNVYTSIGVNRTPSSLDWGSNGLICYGACNAVAILSPTINGSCKIIKTLVEHTERVNTVKWIQRNNQAEFELVSGGDDSRCIYWNIKSPNDYRKISLNGHENSVTSVDAVFHNNEITIVTSSADSTVRLWRFKPEKEEKEISSFQVFNLSSGICFAVKLFVLPTNNILLAFATDDDKVHICGETSSQNFDKLETLLGHEDWVRSLDFTLDNIGDVLLATSSQDSFIRLWRISERSIKKEISVDELIKVDERTFAIGKKTFVLSLESVLQGHENWVYSVCWNKNKDDGALQLLSSSMDKTMIIWTGHFKEVKDICWEPKGEFLFSVSTDQTTRIHAAWTMNKCLNYHEISRPQVHGYDMQCIAVISRYKFASAAEEKIVRTFQAPGNFIENFRNLVNSENDLEGDEILKTHQKGASVPSLGLSNKAVYEEDLKHQVDEEKKFKDEYPENYFVPMTMQSPPTEEYLIQNTLWPESQKLYAHGYELYSLAATIDGKILASACKATTVEHSEIILWNTNNWKILQRLRSHKLTVTQMKFSHDSNRLLSVSRDRRLTIFEKNNEECFEAVAYTDRNNGIHERIIWCCCWSHDDKFFATGSRDGKVVVWTKSNEVQDSSLKDYQSVATLVLETSSVTALAFAQLSFNGYLLAIGLESGIIHIYKFNEKSFECLTTLNHSDGHHLSVNKLEFRPNFSGFQLASCGNDHLVRIYDIQG